MSKDGRISRRTLIKDAALGAAVASAAAVVGLVPSEEEAASSAVPQIPDKWDREADVVVVGFGGAGGAAAIEAHDAGAKVIILEKMPTPGGSTTICAGVYYGAGTSLQKAEGIEDSADEMFKYVIAMGEGLADPELVRVWADMSAETFDWLKELGAEFYSDVNYLLIPSWRR
jgi:3-oxo-5alpha-steroid 4-dehydrogenase